MPIVNKMKIISVVGARPNFIKIAPLIREIKNYPDIEHILVHTGQHYDKKMSDLFFRDLKIPNPDYNLGVGSGSHAEQTAKIMMKFEKICLREKPDIVIVVGDVNSTIASALVAKKLMIKVAHVEAGLRSFDITMPEEINRILTDHISDYLFVSEKSGVINLIKEGIPKEKIFFVGNVMIDSLKNNLEKIKKSKILTKLSLKDEFAILTLHRPSNVDNKEKLKNFLICLKKIQEKIKIVWPIHPRTKNNIDKFDLGENIKKMKNIIVIEPLSYLDFIALVMKSRFVLTDSGGIQEETTYLGIPCVTLRKTTERPSTVEIGTNILVGEDLSMLLSVVNNILKGKIKIGRIPKYWDGLTAKRIIKIILNREMKR